MLKKILKYIILVILLTANIRYIYNEFNIYLKNENHTLRYFLHPKYESYWRDEEGVGYGFDSEYGNVTLYGKILEDKYTYKLGLRAARGWGRVPDLDTWEVVQADVDPKEEPEINLDIILDEYGYLELGVEAYATLDGSYEFLIISYYEEEEKKEPRYIRIFTQTSNNSPKNTSYYIYPGIYGIEEGNGSGGIGENASEILFSQKEAKEMIEKITNLKITEIFTIADGAVEHLMKSYKNVLFKGTVHKILKTIVIFIIQIFLYKVFVYIYIKKKNNKKLEQKYL